LGGIRFTAVFKLMRYTTEERNLESKPVLRHATIELEQYLMPTDSIC
jgi:hypothetical protein